MLLSEMPPGRQAVVRLGERITGANYHEAYKAKTTEAWWLAYAKAIRTRLDGGWMLRFPDAIDFLIYRKGSGDTVEIYDIAVCNENRRQGRGRILMEMLFALEPKVYLVWAITRADNLAGIEWYEAMKFRVVANLREFYGADQRIDAIMLGRSPLGPV